MKEQAHIIYLRGNTLLITKVNYPSWQDIQDDFEHYMTSLGPWMTEEIITFFQSEYKDERDWVFSASQIREFMKSKEHLLMESDMDLLSLQSKSATALQFNLYINTRNLDGLGSLMSDNHTFIDSSNEIHSGKNRMIDGWQEFFNSYPDYQNVFEIVKASNGLVIMIGYSTCSYSPLDGPAIWTAKIRDGLLFEWRVYLDTPENRLELEIK